ncbi:MAG TPA: hypothetical protein PLD47_11030 [Aggregatilineales bacterium]|nr:hypothetical protein [Anaerolineales bacterium]HRE48249.1 hypothetical protein [Aggregatilineales bacterium]
MLRGFQAFLRLGMILGRTALVQKAATSALTAGMEAANRATHKHIRQVFAVDLPLTVFVRGSQCELIVRREAGDHVELNATLLASFGVEFVTEQDEHGVYIVAKRRPMLGKVSRVKFSITLPPEANLVVHLTPGTVMLHDVDGAITIPAAAPVDSRPALTVTPPPNPSLPARTGWGRRRA